MADKPRDELKRNQMESWGANALEIRISELLASNKDQSLFTLNWYENKGLCFPAPGNWFGCFFSTVYLYFYLYPEISSSVICPIALKNKKMEEMETPNVAQLGLLRMCLAGRLSLPHRAPCFLSCFFFSPENLCLQKIALGKLTQATSITWKQAQRQTMHVTGVCLRELLPPGLIGCICGYSYSNVSYERESS